MFALLHSWGYHILEWPPSLYDQSQLCVSLRVRSLPVPCSIIERSRVFVRDLDTFDTNRRLSPKRRGSV